MNRDNDLHILLTLMGHVYVPFNLSTISYSNIFDRFVEDIYLQDLNLCLHERCVASVCMYTKNGGYISFG